MTESTLARVRMCLVGCDVSSLHHLQAQTPNPLPMKQASKIDAQASCPPATQSQHIRSLNEQKSRYHNQPLTPPVCIPLILLCVKRKDQVQSQTQSQSQRLASAPTAIVGETYSSWSPPPHSPSPPRPLIVSLLRSHITLTVLVVFCAGVGGGYWTVWRSETWRFLLWSGRDRAVVV